MGIEVPTEYGGRHGPGCVRAGDGGGRRRRRRPLDHHVGQQLAVLQRHPHPWQRQQKQTYVRAIAEGTQAIGAFALTEPQSGSDATAMRCRAVKQADGTFVINGKKSWITSGPVPSTSCGSR